MSQSREISDALSKIADTYKKDYVSFVTASVTAVNEDERTCDATVIEGDSEISITSIRLITEPNDGFLVIPAIGSLVLVAVSKKNVPYVLMFSELDKVYLVTDTLTQFNDGSFGGLVKVSDLVTKLNNLENKVNSIINAFNTHTHAGVTVGSGVTGTGTPPITGTLTPTQRGDIENTVITHGE